MYTAAAVDMRWNSVINWLSFFICAHTREKTVHFESNSYKYTHTRRWIHFTVYQCVLLFQYNTQGIKWIIAVIDSQFVICNAKEYSMSFLNSRHWPCLIDDSIKIVYRQTYALNSFPADCNETSEWLNFLNGHIIFLRRANVRRF